jgi:toxin-antitoxin system PIN domain toxin
MTPDVNVLLAAFRRDHPHHRPARHWLESACSSCAAGHTTLVLLPMVAAGFLRLTTNPRVFQQPDPIEAAVGFLDTLLAAPGVEIAGEGEWPLLRSKLLAHQLHGNAITDAWIAAATEALSEHLVSFDRGLQRLLPPSDLTLLP